ncbi:hypothetical protein [Methylobacterium sp. J-078]
MRLISVFEEPPTLAGGDVADDRLSALVNVHVFDADLLLAAAP